MTLDELENRQGELTDRLADDGALTEKDIADIEDELAEIDAEIDNRDSLEGVLDFEAGED